MFKCIVLAIALAVAVSSAFAKTYRDPEQRRAFMQSHPCPSTGKAKGRCPGYVVDHINPLCAGGPDRPSNMQWQTVQESKDKDRRERAQCKRR
jgi:hypothetical protein